MELGEPVDGGETDWQLVSLRLAEGIFGSERALIVGFKVCPVRGGVLLSSPMSVLLGMMRAAKDESAEEDEKRKAWRHGAVNMSYLSLSPVLVKV